MARLRGVTLIESVLFISLALALIVGGLTFFDQASLAERTTRQTNAMLSIVVEARTRVGATAAEADLPGEGDPLVEAARIDDMLVAGGSIPNGNIAPGAPENRLGWPSPIRHEWDGAMNILAGRRDGDKPHLLVYLEDLPTEVCIRLSSLGENGKSSFADRVTEVVFQPEGGSMASLPTPENPLPVTPAELATPAHCGTLGGRANVMYWVPLE